MEGLSKPDAIAAMRTILDLLSGRSANLDTCDAEGRTALHAAAGWGSWNVALLLKHGADINARTPVGATPLMLAVVGKPADAARTVTTSDSEGTMIGESTRHGFVVKTLLEKGSDTTLRNADGKTALDLATEKGDRELLDLLEKSGGDE